MSAASQTYLPTHIFVVDDLNQPESEEVVQALHGFNGVSISYIPGKPGSDEIPTAGRSRNIGASLSSAEYIAFLDDDDIWEPTFIEKLMDALRSEKKRFALCDTDNFRNDWRGTCTVISQEWDRDHVLSGTPGLTGSNFLIEKSLFDAIHGFDPGMRVANDWDFVIRLTLHGQYPAVVNTALALHRGHDLGQLTSPSDSRAVALEKFLEKHRAMLTPKGIRYVRIQIHAVRRKATQSLGRRVFHTAMQILLDSPVRLARALLARMTGKPTVYT